MKTEYSHERDNPFPGLRPFRSDEHHLFFGREEQTASLLQLLRTNRFLAVVGTSGSGKSSLVRAGMIAELHGGTMTQAGSTWEVMVLRPGGSPIENLARAFVDADLYDPDDLSTLPRLLATLCRSRFGLVEAMKQSQVFEPGTNLLVVVDQFEELFRFRQQGVDSEETAAAFVNLLLTASEQAESPIYVTITMRSDYLGDCSEIPGLAEAVNEGEYLIPRLLRDQKRDAIEKPIGVGGAKIAPMLVQRLLNEVGDDPDQLPVLQHALMRMWDAWSVTGDHNRPIDAADFEATGGLNAALSNHADEIFDALPSDRHRSSCERIFKTLTEKGEDNRGIRRPTRLSQLQAIAGTDRDTIRTVLDAYRGSGVTFLMPGTEVELSDRTVLDLSHESLMRGWQRLRGWVEEEAQSARIFRRLLDTARLWSDRKAGLFRDPDLQIALSWRDEEHPNADWAEQYGGDFGRAIAFLEASHAEVEAEEQAKEAARQRELDQARQLAEAQQLRLEHQQRATRKLHKMIAGLAAVAVIAGLACIAALVNNHRANTLAETARRNEDQAKRNESRAKKSEDATAKALAIVGSQKREVESSLAKAEQAEENGRKLLYTTDMRLAPFVWNDGRATAEQLRTLLAKHIPDPEAFDAKDRSAALKKPDLRGFEWNYYQHLLDHSASVFRGHPVSVVGGAFAVDGPLVTLDENGQVRRWDLNSLLEDEAGRHDLSGGLNAETRELSPSGQRVALVEENKVHVFDTASGIETFQIDSSTSQKRRRKLVFSGDGATLVLVDDKIRWFNAINGETIATHARSFDTIRSLSLSADGRVLAVVGHSDLGRSVSSFRVDRQAHSITPLAADVAVSSSSLRASAMSRHGERIAIGMNLSGYLVILDAATGNQIAQNTSAHASPISALAFSDDGSKLATADDEGTIKIWADVDQLNAKSVPALSLKGHQGAITSLLFSADGKWLVSTSTDKSARIWDLENAGASIRSLGRAGSSLVASISPDGHLIAATSFGTQIRLWDAETGQLVREMAPAGEDWSLVSVEFSPTDRRILAAAFVSASGVSHVTLWDIDEGTLIAQLPGTNLPLYRQYGIDFAMASALAFSPDGKYLVAGYGSKKLLTDSQFNFPLDVWEVATRRNIRRLSGHMNFCVSLDFTPDGSLLASGSRDGTAILWNTNGWKALRTLQNPDPETVYGQPGQKAMVEGVAFSPDGKMLAMASRGGNIFLWDVHSGQRLDTLKGHSGSVQSVKFSRDGRTLASGSQDQTVRLWNVETGRELMQLDPGNSQLNRVETLRFSPDGKKLVVAGSTAAFWTAETIFWNDPDRAAEDLRGLLKSNVNFKNRIRLFSENLRLHEALAKLDPKDPRIQAALAATQANWHASRKAWPEAVAAFDRLLAVSPNEPESWLRTPGLLRLATALTQQDRYRDAAALLAAGAARRSQDGLLPVDNNVALGLQLMVQGGQVQVVSLMPESPAAKSNLNPGDVIIKVNDTEMTPQSLSRFSGLVSASAGTPVRLVVRRGGNDRPEEIELHLERFLSDPATGDLILPLRATIDERLAKTPRDAGLLELRAELAGQWSDTNAQIADYTAAIKTLTEQPAGLDAAGLQRLYRRRGDAYVRSSQWREAVDDYARVITDATTDETLLSNQATAQAGALLDSGAWTVLRPTEIKSKAGATLKLQDDGSILASGNNASGDVYTISGIGDIGRLTAVRLEVLPDSRLPNEGPGRHSSGNFHLSAFRVHESSEDGANLRSPLAIASVWASFDYKFTDADIAGTIDESLKKVWHVWGHNGEKNEAVFFLKEPVQEVPGRKLTIELRFKDYGESVNLGRFRLSAYSASAVALRQMIDLSLQKILDPWQKLAAVYRIQGNDQAIDQLVDRHPKLAGPVGDLFAKDKDWQRAIVLYSKGISVEANDVALLSKRALAHEGLGEWDAASADWTLAASGNPDAAQLLDEFARRLAGVGKNAFARRLLEKARALDESSLKADPENNVIADELTRILSHIFDLAEPEWKLLKPAGTKTESGTNLTLENDGSIIVQTIPNGSPETVRWEPASQPVEALRVETSTLRDIPKSGTPFFNESQVIAASMAGSPPKGLRGRYVRLDLPGDNALFPRRPADKLDEKMINLSELQVFQGKRNLALNKLATMSSGGWEPRLVAAGAVDGNTVGNDSGNPYAHTASEENPWWEVDLGSEESIDRMVVWNRSEVEYYTRMNHFRVRVLDSARRVVFEQVVDRAPTPFKDIDCSVFLAKSNGAAGEKNQPLLITLPPYVRDDTPRRYRVSTAATLADLRAREDRDLIADDSIDVNFKLAVAYAKNGLHDKSLQFFQNALEHAGDLGVRKRILESAARYDKVVSSLINQYPDDPQLQLALARELVKNGKQRLEHGKAEEAQASLERALAVFMRLNEYSTNPHWTVLTPAEMSSEAKATFTPLGDRSVLAGGPTPPKDTYTLRFRDLPSTIAGLRLEVLTDDSLPAKGPGRGDGNIVLTRARVETEPSTNPGVFLDQKLARASADYAQNSNSRTVAGLFDASGAIDLNDDSFWAIWPKTGRPHEAVFELAKTIEVTKDTTLQVVLEFQSRWGHALAGRFRLSATEDDPAFRTFQARNDLKSTEVEDLYLALAKAHSQQGRTDEIVALLTKALSFATDRTSKANFIKEAATHPGLLEKLAEKIAVDGEFQAALARHFASEGKIAPAMSARTKACAALESQLQRDPGDEKLMSELCDLLFIDTSEWTVLKPFALKSNAGLALTTQDDQSIYVIGNYKPEDVYTVDFRDVPKGVRAIRLEALRDERLPGGGPGTYSGLFVLSEFKAFSLGVGENSVPAQIPLRAACATFEERPAQASLEPGESGWSISNGSDRSQTAYFTRGGDAPDLPSDRLRVTLEFSHKPEDKRPAILGRFRVSVSTDPNVYDKEKRRVEPMKIADTRLRLAAAYAENSNDELALRHFSKVFESSTSGEARKLTLDVAQRYPEILASLIKLQPDDPQTQLALARELVDQGKAELATKHPAEAIVSLAQAREIMDRRRANYVEPKWSVLTPDRMTSDGGASLAIQPDGAILVSGKNPDRDAYTIFAKTDLKHITALRLEALPDQSLPLNGPGRSPGNGNFNLNELRLYSGSTPCPLTNIVVDYDEFSEARLVIDRRLDSSRGWSNYPRAGKPNMAVIATDLRHVPTKDLRIELYFSRFHYLQHALGRFRISVTSDPNAFNTVAARQELKDREVMQLDLTLANAYFQLGQTDEALASFIAALAVATDRAEKFEIIQEVARLNIDMMNKLAERVPNDVLLYSELARYHAVQGNKDLGEAARAKARHLLEEQLATEADNSALAAQLADLLLKQATEQNSAGWKVLTPVEVKSEAGATLALQEDGSILASGQNTTPDVYTLTFSELPETIRSLRLEVLPDESLPEKGPGRNPNGNMVLTEITTKLKSADQKTEQPLTWKRAAASYEQELTNGGNQKMPITAAIDGNETSSTEGWAILPEVGKPQSAVFDLGGDVAAGAGFSLAISLAQEFPQHSIGRFRLSSSGNPAAFDREKQHYAVMMLADPWARLAASYLEIGEKSAFDSLVKRHPSASVVLGDLYAAKGDWERATVEYDKILKDDHVDEGVLDRIATSYMAANRTSLAVPFLAKLSAATPDNSMLSMRVAALQAWFGQTKDYADTKRRLLAFARDSNDAGTVERAAKSCNLLPNTDKAELNSALALAHKSVELGRDSVWLPFYQLSLGLAEYRDGQFEAADATLATAINQAKDHPHDPKTDGFVDLTASFYRASCLFRRGKTDEARTLAIASASKMKPLPSDEQNPLLNGFDHDDLILWLAYKEAKALIGFDDPLAEPKR